MENENLCQRLEIVEDHLREGPPVMPAMAATVREAIEVLSADGPIKKDKTIEARLQKSRAQRRAQWPDREDEKIN